MTAPVSEAPSTRAQVSRPSTRPSVEQLWAWLADVPDPEIPVVSIVDLGIVREISYGAAEPDLTAITITPTYSGCPATDVIIEQIRENLLRNGVSRVEIQIRLSPAWTTDWLTARAKECLREYGIAPPATRLVAPEGGLAASLVVLGSAAQETTIPCPRCSSSHTEMISRFGSTPCKALHRCMDCLEPFDHFKCH